VEARGEMSLAVGDARVLSRFLSSVVEDTIEVPLEGEEDVFYSTDYLYELYLDFCKDHHVKWMGAEDFERELCRV
jgi:hypothetical protein